jgi:hypothetical protein
MRRTTIAALLGIVLLVGVIVAFARSSASGAPEGRVKVAPATTTGAPGPVTASCNTARPSSSSGFIVTGTCLAQLPSTFTCVENEATSMSASAPLDASRSMYLTVVAPESPGTPTRPAFATVYIQVTGGPVTPRWVNRKVTLVRSHIEWIGLNNVVLQPEPGTGATGTLTIAGEGHCPE